MPASKQGNSRADVRLKRLKRLELTALHQKYRDLEAQAQIDVQLRGKAFRTRMKHFNYGFKNRDKRTSRPWRKSDFSPTALQNGDMTLEEKRALYSRFRKIANQNINALIKNGFEDSEVVKEYRNRFDTLKEIGGDEYKLNKELSEVVRFLNLSYRDVGWQKAKKASNIYAVQKQRYGYWISKGLDAFPDVEDEKTYWTFYQFMSEIRRRLDSQQFDSESAQVLYGEMMRRGISFSQLFPETDNSRENMTAEARLIYLLSRETKNDTVASRLDNLMNDADAVDSEEARGFRSMFAKEE